MKNSAVLPTGAMGVIDAVMGSDDQHRSVIEKGWREGHEYFRVEPQLICHDGESIQVGGVTGKSWERDHAQTGSFHHNCHLYLPESYNKNVT